MTSPYILGIDPGLGCALAVYKPSGPVLYDMPHGRLAWFFPLLQAPPNEGRSGIDLSVTPRT